nr:hypothetical protein Iba_chr05fCG13620 [Ipomoea batatas]GME20015.1 hypothetical protein Iba_scaffold24346CG0050 [Ipomoea batatas]
MHLPSQHHQTQREASQYTAASLSHLVCSNAAWSLSSSLDSLKNLYEDENKLNSFTVVDELLAAKRSLRATRHHTELLLHFLKRLENNAGQRLVVRALGSTDHERISISGLGRKTFQRRSRGKQGTQMIPMGIQQRKSRSCFEKIGLHIDGLRRNGEWAEDNMRYGNVVRNMATVRSVATWMTWINYRDGARAIPQIHVALRRTPSQPSPLERSMSRTTDATTAVVGSSERSSFAIHEPPFLRFSTGGKITADDDEFPLAAEFVPPTTLSDFHLLHTMPATSDRGVDERQRWPASSSISFSLSLTSHGRRR